MRDYTEIVVVLDRSGSMESAKSDHLGGLRSFVNDQKDLEGDVHFTLIQFDTEDPCEILYDGVPIAEVGELSLIPRGATPLLDAIGRAIAHVERRLAEKKPDQIVVMVITDGEENSSCEFTKATIKAKIENCEKRAWKFIYLGANVDAFHEAGMLGFSQAVTMAYRNVGPQIGQTYDALSKNVLAARSCLRAGGSSIATAACYNFSDAQRKAASGETETSNVVAQSDSSSSFSNPKEV